MIHLPLGSFKVSVLMFLIVLHYILNQYFSKWEVLNINFENQLLCGWITQSGRTIRTAALLSPPVSTLHGPSRSYFPKQVITNHPCCISSSPVLPHTQLWQQGKGDNHHREPTVWNQRHYWAVLNQACYSLNSKGRQKSTDNKLSIATFCCCFKCFTC